MNVCLISHTLNPITICGEAAAICTASDDYLGALRGALACGHESVIEHAYFTFRTEGVSRVLLAQITRHRIASYSVESQRYVEGSGLSTVVPPSIAADPALAAEYEALAAAAARFYRHCLEKGIEPEDARYGLLMGGTTQYIVTMNARELLHLFELRTCNRAQWEIRNLADEMLKACEVVAWELFKNAGAACMQGKPCPEGKKSCGHPRKRKDGRDSK